MAVNTTKRKRLGPEIESPELALEGVILLDRTLQLLALDTGAAAILDIGEASCGKPLDSGFGVTSELSSSLRSQFQTQTEAVHAQVTAGGHEYSCHASVAKPYSPGLSEPLVVVHLRRELSVAEAVHNVGKEYHLTDREQEALIGISMGLSSKELAVRMKISPNTVKAFLRLIMVKMGVNSRAGMIGKLLDQNGRLQD